jgi:pyrimidine operon attenuation protein / uracil phosphoribosyltransferase
MGEAQGTFRKLRLMDTAGMERVLSRMSREIIESLHGTGGFALVGIRTRGVPLARRLAEDILETEKVRVPVGLLDITLYRDDLTTVSSSPVLKRTEINFPVEGKTIVLCDDVLFTGRTVRAAIDAILDFGRPDRILLAVLVDRGRRELPIEAQFVGKKISTSSSEIVSVTFRETDGEDDVWLLDRETAPRTPAAPKRRPAAPKARTAKAGKAAKPAKAAKAGRARKPVRAGKGSRSR